MRFPDGRFFRGFVRRLAWGLPFLLATVPLSGLPDIDYSDVRELRMLSIEELLQLDVMTVSRRAEPLSGAPSAIHVITAEDIRRAGASDIPEALRLATGVHVARSGSAEWSISTRGFNSALSNRVQVLMDGRSLYSPLFSGVFWDAQDTLMEDIERIEVIRGPGATMWGANAVNGVINIITKEARDTQGTLMSGGGGSGEDAFASVRHGGQAGERVWYRVYAKAWERNDTVLPDGTDPDERRLFGQTGFRVDGEASPENLWTVQGDFYDGRWNQAGQDQASVTGTNLLGWWSHYYGEGNSFWFQAYYDGYDRDLPGAYAERRNTGDIDFQHRILLGDRHDVLWGVNARVSGDDVNFEGAVGVSPEQRTIQMYSAFLQDRFVLVEDRLDLTAGSIFEYTTLSELEVQPSVRLSWRASPGQTFWGAVSRAVRTPTRLESDLVVAAPGTPDVLLPGSFDFESEKLWAYEAGYRTRLTSAVSADLAVFYHDYSELRTIAVSPERTRPVLTNQGNAETYGLELSVNYQVNEWWRLKTGYSHLRKREGFTGPGTQLGEGEGNDPEHIFVGHSSLDFGEFEFDAVVRHVGVLPSPRVPAYTELDLRLAWRPNPEFEAALIGRDLIDSHHPEYGNLREVARSIYGKLTWRF